MRKMLFALAAPVAALVAAVPAMAGVTGPSIYVDGTLYRTVGTPTDFSGTGAPASSFQPIYTFANQSSVAAAAPRDPGFRGGRWIVMAVSVPNYAAALAAYDANGSGNFDSYAELSAAIAGGAASVSDTGVRFECPLIHAPSGH
jgi:hypothetical protein